MSYSALVINIMIATPSDVEREKEIITKVIQEWNIVNSSEKQMILQPISWETHSAPSLEAPSQEVINSQILGNADILIGIFWTRLGTPTGESVSGTVEEIEKHINAGKPAMVYFSSADANLDNLDLIQLGKLKVFKNDLMAKGLIETYSNLNEFTDKFRRQLPMIINKNFKQKNVNREINNSGKAESKFIHDKISPEAKSLLFETSKDSAGMIMKMQTLAGLDIETNGRNFVTRNDPRSEATWTSALSELVQEKLVMDDKNNGEIFKLTTKGYKIADEIANSPELSIQ